jgi:hypothetical protein
VAVGWIIYKIEQGNLSLRKDLQKLRPLDIAHWCSGSGTASSSFACKIGLAAFH